MMIKKILNFFKKRKDRTYFDIKGDNEFILEYVLVSPSYINAGDWYFVDRPAKNIFGTGYRKKHIIKASDENHSILANDDHYCLKIINQEEVISLLSREDRIDSILE